MEPHYSFSYYRSLNFNIPVLVLIALLCVVWKVQPVLGGNSCALQVDGPASFSLSPSSPTQPWLHSGPVSLHYNGTWKSTADGSLTHIGPDFNQTAGQDEVGQFLGNVYHFKSNDVIIVTEIRRYIDVSMVMFIQHYPDGLKGTRFEPNKTMSGFPSIKMEQPPVALGYLSLGGMMLGDFAKKFGQWTKDAPINDGLDGTGPLLVFDKTGHALLISPFSNVMAASVWKDQSAAILNWGIMGGVDEIPAGFEHKTVAFCSTTGIGDAFSGWGEVMRRVHKKTDDVIKYNREQDISLTHLGYWTDNGAYYYYNPETGKDYQDTLLGVKKYATDNHIPYRYIQLDSWFYPKDGVQAVTTWDAGEKEFPAGLTAFQDVLQMPVVAHNRYWSINTSYAKENGGLFNFYIGNNLSLPMDAIFWEYLLGHGREEWGLAVYEQDWLNVQLLFTEVLNTNLTLGKTWLQQISTAASKHGVKIQYCMALPRHALQSLEFQSVTQARVSNDYQLQADQWKIGVTSHFSHALGLAPSKDVFWTNHTQLGNKYDKTEPRPSLQTVVAVLSTGPVGPGDRIGATDKDMLMRCCNEDGLILKPTIPALAIDDQLLEMAFQDGSGASGEVWSTHTVINNELYGVLLVSDLTKDYTITPAKAGFLSPYNGATFAQNSIIFNPDVQKNASQLLYQTFNDSHPYVIQSSACNTRNESYCLFYTSPLIQAGEHQVYLLGDLTKWVPMSELRVFRLWQESTGLAVTMAGRQGETIHMTFLLDGQQYSVSMEADVNGCATFVVVDYPWSGAPRTFTSPFPPMDCRFKAPPVTSFPTIQPITTPGHGGDAHVTKARSASLWISAFICSLLIEILSK